LKICSKKTDTFFSIYGRINFAKKGGIVFVSTETFLGDSKVAKRLGIVYGISVYSRTDIGDFFGGIKAAFGGKQSGFAKMIEKNRNEALNSMIAQAESL